MSIETALQKNPKGNEGEKGRKEERQADKIHFDLVSDPESPSKLDGHCPH